MSDAINKAKIICPTNQAFAPFSKYFTFLMPFVFEHFDLQDYDLIISEGTTWPKGVLTTPDQIHISYIHTPPRFLYGYSIESQKRDAWYFKPFVVVIDHFLRIWDFNAAQRPDYLIANSHEVQKRIKKFYGRDSTVIYPPVETETATTNYNTNYNTNTPFYLALGRLAAYKNTDILIKAFNLLPNLNLQIVGKGPEKCALQKLAGKNISFDDNADEEKKHAYLEDCKGLIFATKDEDFGIVPVEAMSHGKAVLAHKSGGVLETMRDGVSGMFFEDLNPNSLATKIKEFDKNIDSGKYDQNSIKKLALNFSKEKFKIAFSAFVQEKVREM
jgi:glycosyltransferase involved in cell wall biosynthesis